MCTISLDAKRIIAYSKEDSYSLNLPVDLNESIEDCYEANAFPTGFVKVEFCGGEWRIENAHSLAGRERLRVNYFVADADECGIASNPCAIEVRSFEVYPYQLSIPDEVIDMLNEFAANQVALELA